MAYDLGEPKFRGICPYPDCDRTFGPYYAPHHVGDALRAHKRAQHASDLPSLRQRETGDASMASATAQHPRYKAPSLSSRHGYR